MKIETNLIPEMTIEAFADQHGLTMQVTDRGANYLKFCEEYGGESHRYLANFKNCEVSDRGCLVSSYGNGHTAAEAISAYAKKISEQHLVFDAFTNNRQEFKAPRFVHD